MFQSKTLEVVNRIFQLNKIKANVKQMEKNKSHKRFGTGNKIRFHLTLLHRKNK